MLRPSTIRPGLLVGLRTSLRGNVQYQVNVIEPAHIESDGALHQTHQTAKTIFDPEEHELAIKTRGKASSMIRGCCAKSDFGLLCQQDREENLDRAIAEAGELVQEFNANARYTRIAVSVVVGRIEQDDARAIRGITSEIRELLESMQDGVQRLDADTIRKAAAKAKDVGRMLSPLVNEKLAEAIKAARSVARKIVAAGEDAAVEVDRATLDRLEGARTAFLDLSEPEGNVEAPAAKLPVVEFGPALAVNLDLDADEEEGAISDRNAQEAETAKIDLSEDTPIDLDDIPAFIKNQKKVALDLS